MQVINNQPGAYDLEDSLDTFRDYLKSKDMGLHTQRAYVSRIRKFLKHTSTSTVESQCGDLKSRSGSDWYQLLNEYLDYLRDEEQCSQNTINNAITAIERFVESLGSAMPKAQREVWPKSKPKPLTDEEQSRFLEAVYRCRSTKDRAINLLLLFTGIKIGECISLDVEDVLLTPNSGRLAVKGSRSVPLNLMVRKSMHDWLQERAKRYANVTDRALFLNPMGRRISTVGVDAIVRKVGHKAHLNLSAQVLRDTCLTNLVRNGNDLLLVAEIGGHRTLETTRRYVEAIPSTIASQAMEDLQRVDISLPARPQGAYNS